MQVIDLGIESVTRSALDLNRGVAVEERAELECSGRFALRSVAKAVTSVLQPDHATEWIEPWAENGSVVPAVDRPAGHHDQVRWILPNTLYGCSITVADNFCYEMCGHNPIWKGLKSDAHLSKFPQLAVL
jgi:hypothetical protein